MGRRGSAGRRAESAPDLPSELLYGSPSSLVPQGSGVRQLRRQIVDRHDLAAARVDDLDRHTFVRPRPKWQRLGAGQPLKRFWFDHALQRLGYLVPGSPIRKKRLADAEGPA